VTISVAEVDFVGLFAPTHRRKEKKKEPTEPVVTLCVDYSVVVNREFDSHCICIHHPEIYCTI
jgi:hypothetical protein